MGINAKDIRKRILKISYECGTSVHIGGSMSMVEILAVLYRDIMRYKIDEPFWEERDRFVLSKGHCALALYAVLAETGIISDEDISTFMKDGSNFGSHPVLDVNHGIECSSGSLGQGISVALGIAKAARLKKSDYKVYTVVGNGECNEGSVWEVFLLAGQWRLDNFTIVIDNNEMQSDGKSKDIINMSNMEEKLSGFNLKVISVDGHDEKEIKEAFQAGFDSKTKVIICNTIKGKGISFMQNNNEWHHNRLIKDIYDKAIKEIEGIL